MRQGFSILLAALLMGGIVGRVSSGSRGSTSASTGQPTPGSGPPPSADHCPGPSDRVSEYLLSRGSPPAAPGDGPLAPLHGDNVETLIATVPDPLGSGLDYQFDLVTAAIQAAAGAVGYSFATSWLPWGARGSADAANGSSLDCARDQPGVLVFRTKQYVLLVFLVGETPTAGVHPAALESAIELARWTQHRHADGEEILRVLGPTYSGSALSLSRVLERHRDDAHPRVRFRIISGSASLASIDAILDSALKPAVAAPSTEVVLAGGATPASTGQGEFQRTIHTHEALRRVAEERLGRLGIACQQIAYLVESSTFFGVAGGASPRDPASAAGCDATRDRWTQRIVFPLHVSDVRRALDRGRDRGGNLEIAGYELPRSRLGLQQDSSSASGDLVPSFSQTSANYEEMALAMEIADACHARTRAFGVEATDARDKRFLIDRVRTLCPGALVFTFEGDLLFAYPDEQSRLGGTLIFSSYSLFNATQGSRTRSQERAYAVAPLSDSESVGIYNAAVVQLDEIYSRYHENQGKGHTDLQELVQYQCRSFGASGAKVEARHPPVWLSIAGRNEILPIAAVCDPQSRSTTPSMYEPPGDAVLDATVAHTPPRPPVGVWMLTLALAAYAAWAAVRRWPARGCGSQVWASAYLLSAALVLFVLIVLTSAAAPHASGWSLTRLGYFALRYGTRWAAGLVLLAVGAGAVTSVARRDAVAPPASWRGAALYWSVVGLAALVLGLGVNRAAEAVDAVTSRDAGLYFGALRAMHLASGVSPLLPLLFLAAAVHLLLSLQARRSSLLEARFSRSGVFTGLFGGSSTMATWADDQLLWLTRGAWRSPLLVVAVLAAVTSLAVVLPWTPTVEGSWFDDLFRVGFLAVAIGVVVCCARAALMWRALRTLLRRTARHPLRSAVRVLPRVTPQERFTSLLSMQPTVRELEISEALLGRCASHEGAEAARRRATLIENAIHGLGVGPLADRRGPWCTEAFREHQRIAEQQAASPELQDRWRAPEALDEERAPSPEELFIARQFELGVAWIVTHIRELLSVTLSGALLLAVASSVYPFPATHALLIVVWTLLTAAALTTIWIVYSFEGTEVAAWMAGASADRAIDWKLAAHVVMLCVVPVVALIAIQFPESASWLARVFDPFFAMTK